jgi:hypothetical protein
LSALAQADVTERWRYYEQLSGMQRTVPEVDDVELDGSFAGEAAQDYEAVK